VGWWAPGRRLVGAWWASVVIEGLMGLLVATPRWAITMSSQTRGACGEEIILWYFALFNGVTTSFNGK